MKTIFKLLALLLALVVPVEAFALEGDDNVEPTIRRRQFCFQYNPTVTGISSPSADPGTANVLQTQALNSGPATYTLTSLHVMPYPARVGFSLNDVNNNDTLTCASIQISGRDQFGVQRTETLSTITETVRYSTYVYATVTRVVATTCSDSTDATDTLSIFTSQYVGLQTNVKRTRDVESACMADQNATNALRCALASTLLTAVNIANDTIDISTANLFDSTALAAGDNICIRTLASY